MEGPSCGGVGKESEGSAEVEKRSKKKWESGEKEAKKMREGQGRGIKRAGATSGSQAVCLRLALVDRQCEHLKSRAHRPRPRLLFLSLGAGCVFHG
jgi:hypothetical protein